MYKSKKPYHYGTGRRKSSVARVRLFPNGTGAITINGRDIDDYFGLETLKLIVRQPLDTTDTLGKVDIVATVSGGGVTGQAGAIRHGLSRALLQYNDTFSRAAALSPSIWVSPEKLSGLVGRAKLEPGTVLYMDYGSREMGNHDGMRCGFAEMCAKVMTRGIHLTSRIVPGGTHSEASWEKQLPFMFHTLMYEVEE